MASPRIDLVVMLRQRTARSIYLQTLNAKAQSMLIKCCSSSADSSKSTEKTSLDSVLRFSLTWRKRQGVISYRNLTRQHRREPVLSRDYLDNPWKVYHKSSRTNPVSWQRVSGRTTNQNNSLVWSKEGEEEEIWKRRETCSSVTADLRMATVSSIRRREEKKTLIRFETKPRRREVHIR